MNKLWTLRALPAASSVGGALLLVLAPKCPLCLAAYLTAAGLSFGGAAWVAPLLRPLTLALLAAALLSGAWQAARLAQRVRAAKSGPETPQQLLQASCCAAAPNDLVEPKFHQ